MEHGGGVGLEHQTFNFELTGRGPWSRTDSCKTKHLLQTNHALNPFIEKHQKDVMGILHCFDRLRFQGSLRYLYCQGIFEEYLSKAKVLFKDFKQFATGLTAELCQRAEHLAQSLGRPFTYLPSSGLSKEEAAQKIVRQDHLKEGLVAVLRCVEPCRTYKMRGNYQAKMLEPRLELGKCLHLYFYVLHPRFGLLHLRLQTWFPFLIHICLNGHEWLARQMDAPGLRYRKADNRFTWIEDFAQAQSLADAQLRTDWVALCEELRRAYHPLHEKIARPLHGLSYYWTAPQNRIFQRRAFPRPTGSGPAVPAPDPARDAESGLRASHALSGQAVERPVWRRGGDRLAARFRRGSPQALGQSELDQALQLPQRPAPGDDHSTTPRISRSIAPRKPAPMPPRPGILCGAGWPISTAEPRFPERPTSGI